jgi:hypothetical protein
MVLVGAGLIRGVISACGNFATSSELYPREIIMTRSTDDAKARQWQQHFDNFDNCDLSVRKFCSQHRLSVHSFQYWSHRLNRSAKQRGQLKESVPAVITSIPEVVIEFGNQMSIRIPATDLSLAKSILQMALSLRTESSSFQPVVVRG